MSGRLEAGRRTPRHALPPHLLDLLRNAQAEEDRAVGAARRPAWRTTRDLLGGVIAAGYSIREVADCVGVGLDSVRTRASRDGWLSAATIAALGGPGLAEITSWQVDGRLPETRILPDGSLAYPAGDLVRALANIPSRPRSQFDHVGPATGSLSVAEERAHADRHQLDRSRSARSVTEGDDARCCHVRDEAQPEPHTS